MPMLTTFVIALPVWPRHSPSRTRSANARHPVERLVDLLDDVDAVDDQRALARHPQRHVEDGAVLGDVDVLAAEHRFAALFDAALAGQLAEQHQRLVGDPVLREVEEEPGAVGDQPLAALFVGGEEVAQVVLADLGEVGLEAPPGGGLAQRAPGVAPPPEPPPRACRRSSSAVRSRPCRSSLCPRPGAAGRAPRGRSRPLRTLSAPARRCRPHGSIRSPTSPWSAKASSVLSGIVLTVNGEAKAPM